MRFGNLFLTVVAVSFLASGPLNACVYYDPGTCGFSTKTAASSSPAFKSSSSASELPGPAFPFGTTAADAASDVAFLRHDQQDLRGLGYQEERGGTEGGSPFAQLFAASFNLTLLRATSAVRGDLKLALDSPSWIQLGDHGLGFPWQEGGSRGKAYPREAPLPPSWTMMLIGLALFGIFASYRKFKPTLLARPPPAAHFIGTQLQNRMTRMATRAVRNAISRVSFLRSSSTVTAFVGKLSVSHPTTLEIDDATQAADFKPEGAPF